jgi:hypothetical protein
LEGIDIENGIEALKEDLKEMIDEFTNSQPFNVESLKKFNRVDSILLYMVGLIETYDILGDFGIFTHYRVQDLRGEEYNQTKHSSVDYFLETPKEIYKRS